MDSFLDAPAIHCLELSARVLFGTSPVPVTKQPWRGKNTRSVKELSMILNISQLTQQRTPSGTAGTCLTAVHQKRLIILL